jgi:hypothetical protein
VNVPCGEYFRRTNGAGHEWISGEGKCLVDPEDELTSRLLWMEFIGS